MKPAQTLIARFLAIFGEPRTENTELFLREYENAISGWDERTLKNAGDRLIAEAKFWPRPAEVNDLCHALMPPPSSSDFKPDLNWTGDAIRTANDLIHSDLGRRAADEGWIGAMHDHIRVHRSLPTPSEVAVLKQQAAATDQAYRDCVEGRGGVFGEALANFGATIMAKRRQLADIAYGRRRHLSPITDAVVHFRKPKATFTEGQVSGTRSPADDLRDASRDTFNEMQRDSMNHMHRRRVLTERSRRMQGGQ